MQAASTPPATLPRLDLYEDSHGGLHICAVIVGVLEYTVYHHVESGPTEDAIEDAVAILAGDTDEWTIEIDGDTSILTHPESRYIGSFRRGGRDGGYWAMTGETPGVAARVYLGLSCTY